MPFYAVSTLPILHASMLAVDVLVATRNHIEVDDAILERHKMRYFRYSW